MIVEIWKNKIKIKDFKKEGRFNYAILEDNSVIRVGELNLVEIKCCECEGLREVNWRAALLKKKYVCSACHARGENNPFYGKTHSDEMKKTSSRRMNGRYKGSKNPFYGKRHSDESKAIISEKIKEWHNNNDNPFLGKKHSECSISLMRQKQKVFYENLSDEQKKKRSRIYSISQRKLQQADPERYKKNKSKGGRAAARSLIKYKMNKLEKLFLSLFEETGIKLNYSIILNYYQFDFGHKESRTLIEVQGDYWHGNPSLYEEQVLNEMQKKNIARDRVKKEWAIKNGFQYLAFWESEIHNNPNKIKQEVINAVKIQVSRS